ncbi:MAG TPA: benzoylformate decarboxylase [Terriglobales bacterium]|nr:benzoylformate decarboxylase [Terriglobales bacterium]
MATVREATYEVLRSLGMTTIFGNPGSNELQFLDRLPSDFRYILALHEGAGLAMADGFCQATGKPVLVSLHAAAGMGQAMGNLVNAQVLGTPLVMMSGQQSRAMLTLEGQLASRDAIELPRPLVKWSFEAPDAASAPAVMARAAHFAAAAPSGPVFVSIPLDDWRAEANDDHTSALLGRHVSAQPTPQTDQLRALADRLNTARTPAFVMGSEVDTEPGWQAGIQLAELCGAGVFLAIGPARVSFPTNHANFVGTLAPAIAQVRQQLTGHDLVVVFGAQTFRYHAWTPGPYLAKDTQLVTVTADPDKAARAPMGDAIVGDPVVAMEQLAKLIKPTTRKLPAKPPAPRAVAASSKITVEQFNAVVASACPPETVFTSEAPSLGSWWETVAVTRPKSFFSCAGAGLGFALPAAVGVSLAYGKRPVVALVGDGSANYSISGLWTAAQLKLPCTFVIVRNGIYQALKDFSTFLDAKGVPGLDLPGIDFVSVAAGYGLRGRRVTSPDAFADALKCSIANGTPSLIEVEVEPTNSGMFGK